MHDISLIRNNDNTFNTSMKKRRVSTIDDICFWDKQWREGITKLDFHKRELNAIVQTIAEVKQRNENISHLLYDSSKCKDNIRALTENVNVSKEKRDSLLKELPNILDDKVPDGSNENHNLEIRRYGKMPEFSFTPKDHVLIGESLGMMDFASATNMSGSRFVVLKGMLSRLERGLANFMIDHNTSHGYTEISPPLLVREGALYNTGQLPKFSNQQFHTTDDRWLIPTAEVPLTNLVAGKILDENDLPLRFTSYTPCFRSEAGAAGRDTRGMIRMHQFGKVEMVSITKPENSLVEHERMTNCAEEILKRLGLPFRTMLLCSGDTGFSAMKTYDIEVWMSGQKRYREISSCSNCGEFQARRMKAKFRKGTNQKEYVHTLNGSGLAIGRTLIAILENYQQKDGGVIIPKPLHSYMGGIEKIGP